MKTLILLIAIAVSAGLGAVIYGVEEAQRAKRAECVKRGGTLVGRPAVCVIEPGDSTGEVRP